MKTAAISAEGESLPTLSHVRSTISALFGLPFVVRIYDVLGLLPPERDAGRFGARTMRVRSALSGERPMRQQSAVP